MSLNIDGGGSVKINDDITSNYSTWSSTKIASSGGGGGGGSGDVSSSISSSVSGAVPIFDGTTGKIIKSSGVICDLLNNLTGINTITSNGYKTNTGVVGELLTASGSVNSTALPNITTLNTKTQNIDSALTDNTKTHFTNKVRGSKLQANNLVFNNEIYSNCLGTTSDMNSLTGLGNTLFGSDTGVNLVGGSSNTLIGYRSAWSYFSI